MKVNIKSKLTSRRFWLSVASFLAGVAGIVTGISADNQTLTIIGAVCTAMATCIYNICEAIVDCAQAEETTIVEEFEEVDDEDDDLENFEYEDVL